MTSIRFQFEHAHIVQLLVTKEGIAKIVLVGIPIALDAVIATLTGKEAVEIDRFILKRKSEEYYNIRRLRIPGKPYQVLTLYCERMLGAIASSEHLPHLFERTLKEVGIPFIPEAANLYTMALEKFLEPVDTFGLGDSNFSRLALPPDIETIYQELLPFTEDIEAIARPLAPTNGPARHELDEVLQ